MPTFEVKRTTPVLVSVTLEAASAEEAEWFAQQAWVEDAKTAARSADVREVTTDLPPPF